MHSSMDKFGTYSRSFLCLSFAKFFSPQQVCFHFPYTWHGSIAFADALKNAPNLKIVYFHRQWGPCNLVTIGQNPCLETIMINGPVYPMPESLQGNARLRG